MTHHTSDVALIARFLERRDDRAFGALYRRHTPRMYGLALRLTGGEEPDAHEVVQEAWVRAVRSLGAFRAESRLSSWLCGICANVWRERLRNIRMEVDLEASQPSEPPPRSTLQYDPLDVTRALGRLAPGYRAVLVLYGIYGYPHAQVADLLGISEGTSKSQLLRGRRALRNALEEREEG